MNLKRPSMFSMFVILGIVAVVIIIVILALNISRVNIISSEDDIEKIDSIEGNRNIAIDTDGEKSNISNEMLNKREVDGFIFDTFDITTKGGVSTISFEIYNPSNDDRELGEYELKVIDEYNNVIGRVVDNVGTLTGLSRREVSLNLKGDIANLTDIQISKIVHKEI